MPRFQNHQGDRTFYCPEAATGADVALDAAEAGHAVRVLRLGAGDAVILFDGRGRFYDAVIARADKRSAVVRVGAGRESQAEPRARVVLLVGCLKGPKTDFLIQKCVELGVAELVFFAAERSVARPRMRADEVSGGAGVPLALSCGAGVSPALSCGAGVSPANASVAGQRPAPQRFAGGTPAPQDRASGTPAPQNVAAGMDPRHLSIVVSACKQCGRASLMPVVVCGSLQAALTRLPDDWLERIVYWEEASPDASRSPIEHRDVSLVVGQAFVVPASAGNPLDATGGVAGNLTGAETGNAFSAEAGTTNVGADEAEGMNAFPAEAGTTNVVPPEGGTTYLSADSRATCTISRGAYALIGPEGGLTAAEVARARQAGFAVRSLGRRILRAETAALTAAALLLHEAGELG